MNHWFQSTFASLGIRAFRVLWFGTIGSFVAFFMSMIVQSVVAFEITGTNTAVGQVVFAQGAGMAGFGPIGGAYADRWPRRRVVVICQLASAAVLLMLAYLIQLERLSIGMLSAAAFLMGTSFAFMGPARQSLAVDRRFPWKVRRLPDRARGECVEDVPESQPRVLSRRKCRSCDERAHSKVRWRVLARLRLTD